MDNYTRKYFLCEIEQLLESRPVEELKPCLLYLAEDGLPTVLDRSGNKAVGNLLGHLEMEYGLGKGSLTPVVGDGAEQLCRHQYLTYDPAREKESHDVL